ncbi:unnamed protein product [Amaranthus hypochondriacus]
MILYSQPCLVHSPYLAADSVIAAVDRSLVQRENMITTLKFHLRRAQERTKLQADTHRTKKEFKIGDWVLKKVGNVAYKLSLPSNSHIRDMVHVSQLRNFCGTLPVATHIPEWLRKHTLSDIQPQAILDRRSVKFQSKVVTQYLIQWVDFTDHEETWEDATAYEAKYPDFV